MEEPKLSREEYKRWEKWRHRAISRIPEISNRVFALRHKMYMGCGFHWSIEKDLGYCIYNLQNFDSMLTLSESIMLEVVFESLHKDVIKAEKQ